MYIALTSLHIQSIQNGQIPLVPSSGFFGWSGTNSSSSSSNSNSGNDTSMDTSLSTTISGPTVLLGMVWINFIANYFVGAAAGVIFWGYMSLVAILEAFNIHI
jgi:hypothetical protein